MGMRGTVDMLATSPRPDAACTGDETSLFAWVAGVCGGPVDRISQLSGGNRCRVTGGGNIRMTDDQAAWIAALETSRAGLPDGAAMTADVQRKRAGNPRLYPDSPRYRLVRDWLVKRPRWHVHLTPASSSWLNQVERFFALLTERQIKHGAHRSVAALQTAVQTFSDQHIAEPTPSRWAKSADDILASIERFCNRNKPVAAE